MEEALKYLKNNKAAGAPRRGFYRDRAVEKRWT
jgi:hypothetical protein